MTEGRNDEGNWIVAVKVNGWYKVALTEQAENIARQRAEDLVLGKDVKVDIDDLDHAQIEGVFVYERKGTVRSERVVRWL